LLLHAEAFTAVRLAVDSEPVEEYLTVAASGAAVLMAAVFTVGVSAAAVHMAVDTVERGDGLLAS
jgi:hypothetical protein